MADCNEVTQIDINALVGTVGSGGVQTVDMLVWGSSIEIAFSARGQIITQPGPFTHRPS